MAKSTTINHISNVKLASNFLFSNDKLLKILIPLEEEVPLQFPVKYLYYHIGERLIFATKTIILFLKNSPENHVHGLGLLLRTVYTDFILASYLYSYYEDEEQMKEQIIIYLNHEITKEESYVSHVRNKKLVNENELSRYIKKVSGEANIKKVVKNKYSELMKIYAVKKLPFPSTAEIVKNFPQNMYGKLMTPFVYKAYDIWKLLSQFEHIGLNSYLMTRDAKTYVDIAYRSVEFVLLLSNIVFDVMDEHDLQKQNGQLVVQFQKILNDAEAKI
jgi:hypothetical protein